MVGSPLGEPQAASNPPPLVWPKPNQHLSDLLHLAPFPEGHDSCPHPTPPAGSPQLLGTHLELGALDLSPQ